MSNELSAPDHAEIQTDTGVRVHYNAGLRFEMISSQRALNGFLPESSFSPATVLPYLNENVNLVQSGSPPIL